MIFVKFLKIPFLQNPSGQLLIIFYIAEEDIGIYATEKTLYLMFYATNLILLTEGIRFEHARN